MLIDTNVPSISSFQSDAPSLWDVADSTNIDDNNVNTSPFSERYLVPNDRKELTGHEFPDKNYDALMMDRNLTPNDKIQFLATNFDRPFFGQNIHNKGNEQYMTRKYGRNIEQRNKITRKKRALYDDMTYFDETNGLLENSKYNGDWYRYLMANFPQLSDVEQRQPQQKTANLKKSKDNISNGQNNDDESMSSRRQKNSKEEEEQRSHSVDKLWYCTRFIHCPFSIVLDIDSFYSFKNRCALAIRSNKDTYFPEAKQCLEENGSKHQVSFLWHLLKRNKRKKFYFKHAKLFVSLCGQEHVDYIVVPYATANKYDEFHV